MKKQLLAVTAAAGLMVSSASFAVISNPYTLGANEFGDFSSFIVTETNPDIGSGDSMVFNNTGSGFQVAYADGNTPLDAYGNWLSGTGVQAWFGAVGNFDMTAYDGLVANIYNSQNSQTGTSTDFAIYVKDANGNKFYGDVEATAMETGNQVAFDFSAYFDNNDVDDATQALGAGSGIDFSAVTEYGIYAKSNGYGIHAKVPEPSVALLLGAGLLGMGYVARRRKAA